MVRQVQAPEGRRKATKDETASFKLWESERADKGFPPWASRDGKQDLNVLQSSQTLRQWADEYCASPKYLKEFVYEKVSSRAPSLRIHPDIFPFSLFTAGIYKLWRRPYEAL